MLLSLLLACPPPADDPDEPWSSDACSEVVDIPTGLLEDEDVAADPHQEVLGADPAPRWIRYQWPSRQTDTSAAFLWATDLDTLASAVLLGPAEGFPDSATRYAGASFLYGGTEVGEGPYRLHEVRLCGRLTPGTTYSYRVGGEGAWSETFTFTTPDSTLDTFRIGIAGDSRGAYETWGQVVAAFDAAEVDFILFSGDMVEFGSIHEEWESWLEASGDVLARRPILPAHGNHEFLSQNYFAQFALPGNEEWYSVDYGGMRIAVLNDTVRDATQLTEEQAVWLDETLSEAADDWKIAMHHQSAYATCTTHGSDLDVRAAWVPVYDRHAVHAVFAGHNHIYERSVPIRDGEAVGEGEGTVYVVTGGAGAPLYGGIEEQWFGSVAEATNHYLIADVSPQSIAVTALDLSGNTIDAFTIPR
jgi:predicted phosphodiesterase